MPSESEFVLLVKLHRSSLLLRCRNLRNSWIHLLEILLQESGTAKFLKALKDSKDAGSDNNLIGQFGVGFYSAFLVADRVIVSTKSPKSDKQYVWEGEANASSYTIREETEADKLIPRGTRLTLYLKDLLVNLSLCGICCRKLFLIQP
ncbi:unnamed protein product, partial [Linum tenue]